MVYATGMTIKDAVSSTSDSTGSAVNLVREDGALFFEVQAADGTIMRAGTTEVQARSLARWILRDEA